MGSRRPARVPIRSRPYHRRRSHLPSRARGVALLGALRWRSRLLTPCSGFAESSFQNWTESFSIIPAIRFRQNRPSCSAPEPSQASRFDGGDVGRTERVEHGLIQPSSMARRSRSACTSHSWPDGRTQRRPGPRLQDGQVTSRAGSRGHPSPQKEQNTVMGPCRYRRAARPAALR